MSHIYKLFRNGDIRIDGSKVKPEYKVSYGEKINIFCGEISGMTRNRTIDDLSGSGFKAFSSIILFENEDLLLINKPRGLLTHGEDGIDMLASAYFKEKSSRSLAFTPAPLHRLDRNTSGILAVSASIEGARQFSAALAAGGIKKKYLALLEGRLEEPQQWRDTLVRDSSVRKSSTTDLEDGVTAISIVEPLHTDGKFTLAAIQLETGRTHQIRVQCAAHGFPLRGDAKYGSVDMSHYYILHAAMMVFPEDFKVAVPRLIHAPLPLESHEMLLKAFGSKELQNALNRLDYKQNP